MQIEQKKVGQAGGERTQRTVGEGTNSQKRILDTSQEDYIEDADNVTATTKKDISVKERPLPEAWEKLLVQGDLSVLNPGQRAQYYLKVCESVGLNHYTKPFDYITLNGKLTLYAKRDATDQLRKIYNVSVRVTDRMKLDDLYVVKANATLPNGREDESIGAVFIGGMKGESLANAMMKAETKAKRRVTLSICGLGLLDEIEATDAQQHEERPPLQPYTPPQYIPGLEPKATVESLISAAKEINNDFLITSVLDQLYSRKEFPWIEKIIEKAAEAFPGYTYPLTKEKELK